MSRADELRRLVVTAPSMTAAMADWCQRHEIGAGEMSSEVHSRAETTPLPDTADLGLARGIPVSYRAVTLRRGEVALLSAETWFVPGRLTQDTLTTLHETETPFGFALRQGIQDRQTVEIRVPPDTAAALGAVEPAPVEDPEVAVIHLRGVVTLDGVPVAFVEERLHETLLA